MFPGYKHVREFGSEDQYEKEDEEECYVILDLGYDVDKTLVPNTTEFRLVGLDTETPMLQLHGSFFIGRHEELIGTELLFEKGRDETNPSKQFVVPFGITEQRIRFQQVEIKPKEEPLDDDLDPGPRQNSSAKATSKMTTNKRASKPKFQTVRKSSKAKGKEPVRDGAEEEKEDDENEGEDMMAIDDISL